MHHEQSQRKLRFDVQWTERQIVHLAGEIQAIGADGAGGRSPGFTIRGTSHAGEGYRKAAAAALGRVLREVVERQPRRAATKW
jgi:hypothetical protein